MEPITPHYVSLGLLKFPDIVKLNTCLLFYDYFNNDKFATLPVSLVSEPHNYNICSASSNQLFLTSSMQNKSEEILSNRNGKFFWEQQSSDS